MMSRYSDCIRRPLGFAALRRQRLAVRSLERVGVGIGYEHEWDENHDCISGCPPPGHWISRLVLGRHFFSAVDTIIVDHYEGEVSSLAPLSVLASTTAIGIIDCTVGDRICQFVSHLTRLTDLSLYGTDITDEGLSQLNSLTRLSSLTLSETLATDQGISVLQSELPNCSIHR